VTAPVRYREAGRSYLTTWVLFAVVAAGFIVDLAFGAGVDHIVGWALALVVIVGAEALTVYAARVMRTITITDDEVVVGEKTVARSTIASVGLGADAEDRVLGRRYATGLPRGTQGISLDLEDSSRVVLATRHPEQVLVTLGAQPELPAEVRLADPEDLALLNEIEERAGSLFRVAGYDLPEFEPAADRPAIKRVLVIGRPPIGYVELAEVDGEGYLAQVSVLPGHMRRGRGTALVNAACDWAREQGYRGITLATYTEVAWNGPFYRGLGFIDLADLGPGLTRIRQHEAEVGLDAVGPRTVLRYDLT
jgi:GNAT superfamily N-acetyltransferase